MPIKMLTIEDLDLEGKRVFLRVDVNTPIHPETGALMERARLEEAAMTVNDLPKSKVVVASHQGRVGRSDYTSLEAHAKALGEILGREVRFVPDVFGPDALSLIDSLPDGGVLMLDNLRFTAEENQEYKPADAEKTYLVKRLSGHLDACVLDAFSTAHRASPTIVGFAGLVPTCAGRTVGRELRMLDRIATVEKGPYVTVLGGAKVNDRLEAIDALIANGRADRVLLCGVVGLVFLRAAGKLRGEIGVDGEQKLVVRARQLMDDDPDRFVLPVDVATRVDGGRKEVEPWQIGSAAQVLDIGSRSVDHYSRYIKGAGTVFMSGPPGAFEWEEFSLGTEGLLRAMASSLGTTIISGGHLSTALRKYGIHDQIDHISTAGGALVQYLAGKRLPLIDALERAAEKWGRTGEGAGEALKPPGGA
ncbi:MAG: phosphoglycerate kinase [Nitrososphaerota archaeon]|jgi:phosphoglycerate kinase|nr:phosphoglycerate kinase [Nitrososphaerota archaeon]MDG6959869.1 phosphoglycerate kinase [Nitrososphaerota archaeon]MDG7015097.1 phosphoglycerate kinase [Nitrososphaerota archaeon]WGO49876.1 MAG: phosphoglycerate kinase [Nitrososphaerota archaeon]